MFTDFFYLLRNQGLKVSMKEWLTLIDALNKGLAHSSLLEFYYLSRAVLVKTEADFDKFDMCFARYFRDVKTIDELPEELMSWLLDVKEQAPYDKDEVDERSKDLDFEAVRKMMEERLEEQKERHDGGKYWIGTGGTSVFGNSGYNSIGIRVGGSGGSGSALQMAGERHYKDFREDTTLNVRHFQLAFRRLRQFSSKQDGAKTELDIDETIEKTCNNAGRLKLVFERPRTNMVKLLILFDSGGSMWPYTQMCNSLFQAVSKSNHFKDLKIYYFHNCFYQTLYKTPSCYIRDSIDTDWVFRNLDSDYKVIVIGDASMSPSELIYPGGANFYNQPNEKTGLEWIQRFRSKYEKMIWLNPIPEDNWHYGYGHETIELIEQYVPMYHLTVKGMEEGFKSLLSKTGEKKRK